MTEAASSRESWAGVQRLVHALLAGTLAALYPVRKNYLARRLPSKAARSGGKNITSVSR
jgi:hypothetical protein